jgi:hypothetical protein
MSVQWGTFAPDSAPSYRRLQTLGLTVAIRHYNDRSVPGLGGLSFGMPIAWSLLGVWLAEEIGNQVRPLSCANAIEAAIMTQALKEGRKRARGHRKLAGVSDTSFKALSARGAYVTQPYRMGTVEPLLRLGLVVGTSQRFNMYRLAPSGERILQSLKGEQNKLRAWATGSKLTRLARLAPDVPLPTASAKLLERQLRDHGDAHRRRALLDLSDEVLRQTNMASAEPPAGIEQPHWNDIRSGVALIQLRDAALDVIAAIEKRLTSSRQAGLTVHQAAQAASSSLELTAVLASTMLARDDTSPGQLAHEFARACRSPAEVTIAELAKRDGTVIRLLPNGQVGLGPAGGQLDTGMDDEVEQEGLGETATVIPELPRIHNLYALKRDLQLSMADH